MQILAVVVRYKVALEESQTMLGLCRAFAEVPELAQSMHVFLWDNTPEPLAAPNLPIAFEYRHTGENLGVSGAYNRALDFAELHKCPWLLTLDQDTTVEAAYLKRMLSLSYEVADNSRIASIVPFVRSHGELVSPRRLGTLNRVFQVDRSFSGVLDADAYAINSASLMRCSALRGIGGYSEVFWLDLSDVYVFQRMHEQGKVMFVAGELEIEHSIAGMDFEKDMVPERYKTFLAAENAYLEMYQSRFENAFQSLRLLLRAGRQYRGYRDKNYARLTWQFFLVKLFTPRKQRVQQWREHLLRRRQIPLASELNK